MNIGIIGYGYWGPNLVRNFSVTKDCSVKMVCDQRTERLNVVQKLYPSINVTQNKDELISNKDIDAVVIATPVSTHFPLAKQALLEKKHVLLEKPMTDSVKHAEELIDIANKNNLLLMVDHTFLYTGAIQKMKDLIFDGSIGNINYFDSTRINLGLFQSDINVIWDLATHDISILYHLIKEKPYSVQAIGISHTDNKIENIAYLTVHYSSKIIAHFNVSWASPVKIRQMLIGGDKKMIVFNDMEESEKVKIYDTGYEIKTDEDRRKILVDYRVGDVFVPKIDRKEALAGMASDFVKGILEKKEPISNWELGLDVVKVLEAAEESIKNKGKEIIL